MEPYIIIGAGPAGLMAAQKLAERGKKVLVFDQKKAAARKFLVAGHGGFNLTHAMPNDKMLQEYEPNSIINYLNDFTNTDTINWLYSIGIDTFIGSSGKVFPAEGIKPIQVLEAWLKQLHKLGVTIFYNHELIDFTQNSVTLISNGITKTVSFYKLILALGGASWPQTGSTGTWSTLFDKKGIIVKNFLASNTGFNIAHPLKELEGKVLKNISVKHNDIEKYGEFVFTDYGIEGSPIYYLNRSIRKSELPTIIYINLKPQLSVDALKIMWQSKPKWNTTKKLKNLLNLNDTMVQLLKLLPKEDFTNEEKLLHHIHNYPIKVTSFRPIKEGISTVGGVPWESLNENLSIKKYPQIYCIGEMLDWDAPTGGFLLQGCFSMGVYIGTKI